ncbi:MAG: hypothetical protein IV107_16490 [Paucibacter sp.]|nr:hypothetical protein [Roseateles sp.]
MNISQIENSAVAGAQAQVDAAEDAGLRREALEMACHTLIKTQAGLALKGIGYMLDEQVIPSHKQTVCWSALALVQEQLGGSKGDALLIEMMILVRGIARSTMPGCTAHAAMANDLLGKFAEAHADYFASALADEVESDLAAECTV